MSCMNLWKAAVQGVNMPREWERPLEQRKLQAAKEVCLVFQQEILFSNYQKIIDCEPTVFLCNYDLSVAVPLTDPWSVMISWMAVCPQMQNPTKISREHRPHHWSSPLLQAELNQSGNSGRFSWTLLATMVPSRLPNTTPTSCTVTLD